MNCFFRPGTARKSGLFVACQRQLMASLSMFHAKSLILKRLCLSLISDRLAIAPEQGWRQLVFLQQTIKLRAVTVGQAGRVGYIAIGQAQQLDQVVALETLLGFVVAQ